MELRTTVCSFDRWTCIDDNTFDADWDGERYVTTCPIGRGATEEEAIIDFVEQLLDRHNIAIEWEEERKS